MDAFFTGLLKGAHARQLELDDQQRNDEKASRKQTLDIIQDLISRPNIRPEAIGPLVQKGLRIVTYPMGKKLPKELVLSEDDFKTVLPQGTQQAMPGAPEDTTKDDITGLTVHSEASPPFMSPSPQPQPVSIFKSNYETMMEGLAKQAQLNDLQWMKQQKEMELEHKNRMEELDQTSVTTPLYGNEKDLAQLGVGSVPPGRYAIVRSKSGKVLNYYPVEEKSAGNAGKLQRIQLLDTKTKKPFMAIFNPDPSSQYHYFRQNPNGDLVPITDPQSFVSPQAMYGPPVISQTETGEIQGAWSPYTGGFIPAPGGMRKSPLPSEELDKRVTASNLIDNATRLRELATRHKNILGPWMGKAISAGIQTIPEPLRGLFSEKLNDPEVIELVNLSDNARNQLLYALSGKQINEKEYDRLSKLVPRYDTDPSVFFTRLNIYERELKKTLSKKQSGYNTSSPVPHATSVPSKGKYGPTESKTLRDGSKVTVRKNLSTGKYEEVQ